MKGGGGSILKVYKQKRGSRRGSNFGPKVKKPNASTTVRVILRFGLLGLN